MWPNTASDEDVVKVVGLLGYPLKHSISPHFQQAAFDHYGLKVRYEAWEAEPRELPLMIERLRQPHCLGGNVTVPYKEAVLPLLDEIEDLAGRIGAVNTVVTAGARLIGYNTDAEGFLRALKEEAGFDPRGRRALILGAGGAARAVCFALAAAGVASLVVVNRNPHRAEALVSDLKSRAQGRLELAAFPWERPYLKGPLATCDLIVNCTPLGMKGSPLEGQSPLEAELLPRRALVYDVVYNPPKTRLLEEAEGAGARTLGGLPMLVYQGAAAFELWTGKKAPLEAMFAVARQALAGRAELHRG